MRLVGPHLYKSGRFLGASISFCTMYWYAAQLNRQLLIHTSIWIRNTILAHTKINASVTQKCSEQALCACVLSRSVTFDFPRTRALQPARLLCGIFQVKVAVSSSRGSSQPRGQTQVFHVSCTAGRFFTHWAIREALPLLIKYFYWFYGKKCLFLSLIFQDISISYHKVCKKTSVKWVSLVG